MTASRGGSGGRGRQRRPVLSRSSIPSPAWPLSPKTTAAAEEDKETPTPKRTGGSGDYTHRRRMKSGHPHPEIKMEGTDRSDSTTTGARALPLAHDPGFSSSTNPMSRPRRDGRAHPLHDRPTQLSPKTTVAAAAEEAPDLQKWKSKWGEGGDPRGCVNEGAAPALKKRRRGPEFLPLAHDPSFLSSTSPMSRPRRDERARPLHDRSAPDVPCRSGTQSARTAHSSPAVPKLVGRHHRLLASRMPSAFTDCLLLRL